MEVIVKQTRSALHVVMFLRVGKVSVKLSVSFFFVCFMAKYALSFPSESTERISVKLRICGLEYRLSDRFNFCSDQVQCIIAPVL